jgi:hypothetical protein
MFAAHAMMMTAHKAAPVAFHAVGTTAEANPFASTATVTQTPTVASGDALLACFVNDANGDTSAQTIGAVTCAGTAMTQLVVVSTPASGILAAIYGLLTPTTGTPTVSVTVSGATVGRDLLLNCLTYTGVSAFGATTSNTGSGTSESVTGPTGVGSNDMVVNLLGGSTLSPQTSYSQTQRVVTASGSGFCNILLGDAAGASSINFACSGNSNPWLGLAVRLTA